jgi:hypothetical protein
MGSSVIPRWVGETGYCSKLPLGHPGYASCFPLEIRLPTQILATPTPFPSDLGPHFGPGLSWAWEAPAAPGTPREQPGVPVCLHLQSQASLRPAGSLSAASGPRGAQSGQAGRGGACGRTFRKTDFGELRVQGELLGSSRRSMGI